MRTAVLVLTLSFAAWGSLGAISLEATDFAPDPGEVVALRCQGAPPGAEFAWDLDGDGAFESVTSSPRVELEMGEGPRSVALEVRSAGRRLARIEALLMGDPFLSAVRTVVDSGDRVEVTLRITAKTELLAPGFVEVVPEGWGVEVYDPGGAEYKIKGAIEALWTLKLLPGDTLTFEYGLIPLWGGGSLELKGEASAIKDDRYYRAPIVGITSLTR